MSAPNSRKFVVENDAPTYYNKYGGLQDRHGCFRELRNIKNKQPEF